MLNSYEVVKPPTPIDILIPVMYGPELLNLSAIENLGNSASSTLPLSFAPSSAIPAPAASFPESFIVATLPKFSGTKLVSITTSDLPLSLLDLYHGPQEYLMLCCGTPIQSG